MDYISVIRNLFDGGLVLDYLKTVKTFLDNHPDEVLTFIFTNPEAQPVNEVWKPIFGEAGLTPMAFIPDHVPLKYSEWPTLGEMISSGRRLVVFLDNYPDKDVDFILPEFRMIWETPYSVTDESFPCSIDRMWGPLSVADHMYMINHSLNRNILPVGPGVIISDPINADETNSVNSIMANVQGCAPLAQGRNPNFLLLDFVEDGEAFKTADILNGFQPSTTPNSADRMRWFNSVWMSSLAVALGVIMV
ncbi:hypothetical protein PQX77_021719 [Marasmius sp. AFHP31]|nr:hypothetical protein PQX77_021719 [Marasmius sp. AFHP31]